MVRLFDQHEKMDDGLYTIRLFDPACGWKDVIVDDMLPCRRAQEGYHFKGGRSCTNVYASPEGEFWAALLEKAGAKFFGSYDAIGNGGFATWAFTVLTGQSTNFYLSNNASKGWRIW